MKTGETRSFPLTFPADYHGKEVAGRTAQFDADGEGSRRAERAPARRGRSRTAFGIKSGKVEDLRAEVEANLKLELKRKVEAMLKDQALRGLREKTQIALPRVAGRHRDAGQLMRAHGRATCSSRG